MMTLREPQPLIIQIQTGKISGFPWTIETVMERRTGYRLFVDHEPIATFANFLDAADMRDFIIADKVAELREMLAMAQEQPTISAALIQEVERRLNTEPTTACEAVPVLQEA